MTPRPTRRQRLRRRLQDQRDREVLARRHLHHQVGRHRHRAGQFRTPYGVDTGIDPVTGQELRLRRRRPQQPGAGLHPQRHLRDRSSAPSASPTRSAPSPRCAGSPSTSRHGNVWGADLWGDRIERWNRTATGFTYNRTIGAVMPDADRDPIFHEPRGMAFTPSGDLWVTDTVHHAFRSSTATATWSTTCGQRAAEGTQLGQFNWPRGIAVDPATGNLWIADTKQHQLQVLTDELRGHRRFVKNTPAGTDTRSFNWPYDIAIRPSDRFAFVVDTQNHRIKAYDVANATWPADNKGPLPTHVFGSRGTANTNFQWPSGVAVGPDGHVFVADRGNNRIQEFTFTAGRRLRLREDLERRRQPGRARGRGGRRHRSRDRGRHPRRPDGGHARRTAPSSRRSTACTTRPRSRSAPTARSTWPTPTPTSCASTPWGARRRRTPPHRRARSPRRPTAPVCRRPVTLTGTASDDRAVASVRLGIKQAGTGRWWNGTAWQTAATKVTATLASPNTSSTTWSYSLSGLTPGIYGFSTDITDTAGKLAAGSGKPAGGPSPSPRMQPVPRNRWDGPRAGSSRTCRTACWVRLRSLKARCSSTPRANPFLRSPGTRRRRLPSGTPLHRQFGGH